MTVHVALATLSPARSRWLIALLLMGAALGSLPCEAAAAHGDPSSALLRRWQPLFVRPAEAAHKRKELRAVVVDLRKQRWASACRRVEKLRQRLMKTAAGLFYGPTRQGAKTAAIERFYERFVRGAAPLLSTAGEVFVPSPALRDLAVVVCGRANQPAVAERFVAHQALSGAVPRLRLALAVIRLQAGQRADKLLWLVGPNGGGARAALLRALASGGSARQGHLANAGVGATTEELGLIDDFKRWLEGRQ